MNKCISHKKPYMHVSHLFQSLLYMCVGGGGQISDFSKAIQSVSCFEVEPMALFLVANSCSSNNF